MVKALHRAGIEGILDVVYNHTAEGDRTGAYVRPPGHRQPGPLQHFENGGTCYATFTSCGNTLDANHPVVRRTVVASLRYGVKEMRVDSFRFDPASVLSRDATGRPPPNPPVVWDIGSEPALAGTHVIAEAWDATVTA
jgi:glycogen operon protein